MATAFMCEACGEFGLHEPVAIVTVASKEPMPAGKGDKAYDLCGKCLDALRGWLTPPVPSDETPEAFPASSIDVPFGGSRHHG